MGIRSENQAVRSRSVIEAATRLFVAQGYAATTVPQIAAEAGVSVGTVANTGDKDSLFLVCMEEAATSMMLARLSAAASTGGMTVADRVWSAIDATLTETLQSLDFSRDYLVAYLRASSNADNVPRLDAVAQALRALWPEDDLPPEESPAALAALTTYLCLTSVILALASRTMDPEAARVIMRRVVDAQCAPFEEASS